MQTDVSAPAVVKLFGEHVVVHGKPAVAAAIDMQAHATVSDIENQVLQIELDDFGESASITKSELEALYNEYKSKNSIKAYVDSNKRYGRALPYITIAARLNFEFGVNTVGKRLLINSNIPVQKGLASSAACSTAATIAFLDSAKAKIPDDNAIDVARDGERVVHLNENAGKIDVTTSFYGGCVMVDKGSIQKLDIGFDLMLTLIDTGPKKSTAETVGAVTKLFEEHPTEAAELADQAEYCLRNGMKALEEGNIELLGSYMYKNHEILRELGVSSESLEKGVSLAKKYGFYGAKLSGGGGGGIMISVKGPECDESKFQEEASALNFGVSTCRVYKKLDKILSKTSL